jgi:hypothetical protein
MFVPTGFRLEKWKGVGLSCGLTPPFCQTDISGECRSIDVFEKKDNKWQALYSQITKVKKEKE